MRAILLASLFSVAAVGWAASTAKTSAGWKTYRSPDYGFTIDYPESMTFYPGHPVMPPQKAMFPICDDTTVACFQYNGNALDGTPTHAVGVSVNVLRDLNSETDCNTIDTGSGPIRTIRIHGTTFHYGETGEAGLGSGRSMTVYRTLHRHVCFEVALVTAGRNLGPQDVKDEGLHTVSRLAWRRISNYMDRMLYSFTFVGPVKDGPDWSVYSDWGCGGTFEYPSSSKLQKVVEYSNEAYDSSRITCEQAFTYKGREYTAAVKVNLRDDDALDEWLSSSGYPGLEQIKVVAKGDAFTEYRDQTYTYVRLQNDLFIFTVTGASHKPIPSEGDRVFAHFVGSFRVR